jgi:hypothetical protein
MAKHMDVDCHLLFPIVEIILYRRDKNNLIKMNVEHRIKKNFHCRTGNTYFSVFIFSRDGRTAGMGARSAEVSRFLAEAAPTPPE